MTLIVAQKAVNLVASEFRPFCTWNTSTELLWLWPKLTFQLFLRSSLLGLDHMDFDHPCVVPLSLVALSASGSELPKAAGADITIPGPNVNLPSTVLRGSAAGGTACVVPLLAPDPLMPGAGSVNLGDCACWVATSDDVDKPKLEALGNRRTTEGKASGGVLLSASGGSDEALPWKVVFEELP